LAVCRYRQGSTLATEAVGHRYLLRVFSEEDRSPLLCGGEKNECIESTKSIEKWAREAGATQCIIGGRRGWLRALKGYEEKFVVMTKDL
jgi:hypothetical protein